MSRAHEEIRRLQQEMAMVEAEEIHGATQEQRKAQFQAKGRRIKELMDAIARLQGYEVKPDDWRQAEEIRIRKLFSDRPFEEPFTRDDLNKPLPQGVDRRRLGL